MDIRLEMAGIIAHLIQFAQEIATSRDQVDDDTAKLIAFGMAQVGAYGRTTLLIIDNPDIIQPPAGRRCIFY